MAYARTVCLFDDRRCVERGLEFDFCVGVSFGRGRGGEWRRDLRTIFRHGVCVVRSAANSVDLGGKFTHGVAFIRDSDRENCKEKACGTHSIKRGGALCTF